MNSCNHYKIIAESGGTTTTWQLRQATDTLAEHKTIGLNPYFVTDPQISAVLQEVQQVFHQPDIVQLDFYGAGCRQEDMKLKIKTALAAHFSRAEIRIFTDVEAAAFALYGNQAGIVGILGTGSHAAYFDGKQIVKEPCSLGFWLGDEGSGGWIGKQLIHDYFLNTMPQALRTAFAQRYQPQLHTYLDRLYRQPQPNQFAAAKAVFAAAHLSHTYCQALVRQGFELFLDYYVKPLATYPANIAFCGSVAFHFAPILQQVAASYGFSVEKIIVRAIDELR